MGGMLGATAGQSIILPGGRSVPALTIIPFPFVLPVGDGEGRSGGRMVGDKETETRKNCYYVMEGMRKEGGVGPKNISLG